VSAAVDHNGSRSRRRGRSHNTNLLHGKEARGAGMGRHDDELLFPDERVPLNNEKPGL